MELGQSRILRTPELTKLLGVSRSTLWRWERKGVLPPKRRIGPNVAGWFESDILIWLQGRPTGLAFAAEDLLWQEEES